MKVISKSEVMNLPRRSFDRSDTPLPPDGLRYEVRCRFERQAEREKLSPLIKNINSFFHRFDDHPRARLAEFTLAMRIFEAVKDKPANWKVVKALSHEDLQEWIEFLPFRLLGNGYADRGIALCEAWSSVMSTGEMLCLKGYIQAQRSRCSEAEATVQRALAHHRTEWKAYSWAAETYGVLDDFSKEERCYRKALNLAKNADGRDNALRSLLHFLEDHGRKQEADALADGHPWVDEEEDMSTDDDTVYPLGAKVGPRSPCPCGSGYRYNLCCWEFDLESIPAGSKKPR